MDRFSALKAFTRVVEAGSFTRAADSLNMPNATLSKTIQQLEAHLGVSLLQRTTRRITVTPEGREYYEKARCLLEAVSYTHLDVYKRQMCCSPMPAAETCCR